MTDPIAIGVVKADALNLRKVPNSTIIAVLDNLEVVKILEDAQTWPGSQYKWYKVSVRGLTGWVDSRFIKLKEVAVPPPPIIPSVNEGNSEIFWICAVIVGIIIVMVLTWAT